MYDDNIVPTYNYKDGAEALTLQEIESVLSSNLTSMCPPNKTPSIRMGFFVWSGIGDRTRTHLNAARVSAAADGSTEANNYFALQRAKCRSSPISSTIHEKSELLHDRKCVRIFCLYQRHYILMLKPRGFDRPLGFFSLCADILLNSRD